MLSLQARRLAAAAAAALLAVTGLGGDSAAADRGPVIIDVTRPQRSLYPIAVPAGVDSDRALARQVAAVTTCDLSVAGWFRVISPKSFLAGLEREKLGIVPNKWECVGAFGVVKTKVVKIGRGVALTVKR